MRSYRLISLLLITTTAHAASGPSVQRLAPPGSASAYVEKSAAPNVNHRSPLKPGVFLPLPFGSIRPQGWLLGQMTRQAAGLSGHLGDAFPDVGMDSAWLGGPGENWERGPYYARGLIALGWASRDKVIQAKAKVWIDSILSRQRPDGSFGPSDRPDWWPRMLVLQMLSWYQEATADKRVIPFMQKAFAFQLSRIEKEPLSEWGRFRGGDNLEPLLWLYDRTGDPSLLRLASILKKQTFDWITLFAKGSPLTGGSFIEHQHGVNLAQALKFPVLWWEAGGDERSRASFQTGLDLLFRFYGQAFGLFTGEEAVVPAGSRSATELCQVVEYLHSLGEVMPLLGNAHLADLMERAAYNALPAALKSDMRGYQYYILPNQVKCASGPHGFGTDHGSNMTFGGVSGYPCCAVNMHYAWPYVSQRLWLSTPDGGLAAALYAPCEVRAQAGGGAVTVTEETNYPFSGTVTLKLGCSKTRRFPLQLRIPGWCPDARLSVNGEKLATPPAGTFVTLDRPWKSGDVVVLEFPMQIKTSAWENNSVAVERGPLLYSLRIKEEWWHQAPHSELKGPDRDRFPSWEIRPRSAWNYALVLDKAQPGKTLKVSESGVLMTQPWVSDNPPISLLGKGRKVSRWGLDERMLSGLVPWSPVKTTAPAEAVTLVPFGCAKLRVTYLPWMAPNN